MSEITDRLGIIEAAHYHTYHMPVKPDPTPYLIRKRYKNDSCTRQLVIYADERNMRSGLKKLRCIVNCYDNGVPSTLIVFDEHGHKVNSFRLKKDYSAHLPQNDARALARVKRGAPVIVERF